MCIYDFFLILLEKVPILIIARKNEKAFKIVLKNTEKM